MKKTAVIRFLTSALAMAALVASEAEGQNRSLSQSRSLLGISGVLARPVGEFQDFVDWGWGIDLYGVINLSRRGPVGIRIDGSVLMYGHETLRQPLSNTIQRVMVDVDTDNLIGSLGVGPQLTLGQGPLRPYVYGTVGFSYFGHRVFSERHQQYQFRRRHDGADGRRRFALETLAWEASRLTRFLGSEDLPRRDHVPA